MQGTTIKLAGFIGISMIAHGLLLFVHKQPEINNSQPPFGHQILSISLTVNENNKIENKTTQTVHKPTGSSTDKRQPVVAQKELITLPESRKQNVSIAIRQVEPISDPDKNSLIGKTKEPDENLMTQALLADTNNQPVTVSQKKAQQSAQRNFLLGEIHNRLSQHMNYPARARRRGWEGSVMIGFNIDKQGFLRNVHLTQTSGYALLDNAALTAVKKVNYIPLNQWGSVFQPVALQLPVIYRLTNS